jgi:hypothetical protein
LNTTTAFEERQEVITLYFIFFWRNKNGKNNASLCTHSYNSKFKEFNFWHFLFHANFSPWRDKARDCSFRCKQAAFVEKKPRQWIFTCKHSKDKFNQYFETKIKNKSSQLWQIRRSPIGIVIILVESNIALARPFYVQIDYNQICVLQHLRDLKKVVVMQSLKKIKWDSGWPLLLQAGQCWHVFIVC